MFIIKLEAKESEQEDSFIAYIELHSVRSLISILFDCTTKSKKIKTLVKLCAYISPFLVTKPSA